MVKLRKYRARIIPKNGGERHLKAISFEVAADSYHKAMELAEDWYKSKHHHVRFEVKLEKENGEIICPRSAS